MDDNDFLNAFLGTDVLKSEAVASMIGRVVAKLHQGMIEGGMQDYAATALIAQIFGSFIREMNNMYGYGPGASS